MDKIDTLYTKIDSDIKKRAIMYITKSKLLDNKMNTLKKLTEIALDEYMINHPL